MLTLFLARVRVRVVVKLVRMVRVVRVVRVKVVRLVRILVVRLVRLIESLWFMVSVENGFLSKVAFSQGHKGQAKSCQCI